MFIDSLKDFSGGVLAGVKTLSTEVQAAGTAVNDAKAVFESTKQEAKIAAAQSGFAQQVGTAQGQQTGSVGAADLWNNENLSRLMAGVKSNQTVLLIAGAAIVAFMLLKR